MYHSSPQYCALVQAPYRFGFSIYDKSFNCIPNPNINRFFTMHTVVPPRSTLLSLVNPIKTIYSKIRNTKKPRPPIEIELDWPNTRNDELPSLDCRPTQEHCIGLCRSLSYHLGREKVLKLSSRWIPLDWETLTRALQNHYIYPENATEADIRLWRALRHAQEKIGSGMKDTKMSLNNGHIMLRIRTDLPIDKNFIVHGCWQEELSSHQSRCWHMSQTLKSDCDELMLRMRRPLTYNRIECPDGYYWTDVRRCPSCPSEYMAYIYRAAEEEDEEYPYYIQFRRYMDLGDFRQREGESEEFKALTAGQVCCDHLQRSREPPIDCVWQGHDWSTIPAIRERMERRFSTCRRLWYRFWDCILEIGQDPIGTTGSLAS